MCDNKKTRTEENTVCFTGHRSVSKDEIPLLRDSLHNVIEKCWLNGYRWFICGGAVGFDTLAAEEILSFRNLHPEIGLLLAIPCENQDRCWAEQDRLRYRHIRHAADDVLILSPYYFNGCMHVRNQYMIHHSSLCICFLRQFSGGTGYTVRYALSMQKKVINIYPSSETNDPVIIKESAWNYTFISPSAPVNAFIVHSIPFQDVGNQKYKNIFMILSGKHRSGKKK